MKKTQFRIGLLTACLVGVTTVSMPSANAQSCGAETCDGAGKSCKCSKGNCDDKGLLEVINNAATRFESRLAGLIPDEPSKPAKKSCNCPKCSGVRDSFEVATPEIVAPEVYHPESTPPMPRVMAPSNPVAEPIPVPVPAPTRVPTPAPKEPKPDSQVDPFKDESSSLQRSVPTRPASYMRSTQRPVVEYDPQASNDTKMRSILNSKHSAAAPGTRKVTDAEFGLAKSSSTRRPVGSKPSQSLATSRETSSIRPERSGSEVVPASVSEPVSSLRSGTTARTATVESPETFYNPLRDN